MFQVSYPFYDPSKSSSIQGFTFTLGLPFTERAPMPVAALSVSQALRGYEKEFGTSAQRDRGSAQASSPHPLPRTSWGPVRERKFPDFAQAEHSRNYAMKMRWPSPELKDCWQLPP